MVKIDFGAVHYSNSLHSFIYSLKVTGIPQHEGGDQQFPGISSLLSTSRFLRSFSGHQILESLPVESSGQLHNLYFMHLPQGGYCPIIRFFLGCRE